MSTLTSAGVVIDRENPWPGLVSFPEEAEAYFSGRETERDELLRLIRRDTLTLLHGQSGLGKTSLLMAGLFPALRRDNHLPVYVRIDHSLGSPAASQQMMTHLLDACAAQHVEAPAAMPGESLWEYLHRKSTGFWSERMRPVTPVFVIDQFEELLTLGRASSAHVARSDAFLDDLTALVNNALPAELEHRLAERPEDAAHYNFRRSDYRVVIGAREDFVPELEHKLRDRMPAILTNKLRLERLSGEKAFRAIETTGAHLVAPAVADHIVRFLAGRRDDEDIADVPLAELQVEPALLSLFCRELNERRKEQGLPAIESELLGGSKDEILSRFYRESVSEVGESMRKFVEDRLLTQSGYRNSFALDDALREPGVTRDGIDALIKRRLIRLEERFGILRVELTHDVLTGVVKESRDRRRALEEEAERKAREEAQQREIMRVKRAARRQRAVFAAVAVVLLLFAGWAQRSAAAAERARERADEARAQAVEKEAEALIARDSARDARELAEQQKAAAELARLEAERQRTEALIARDQQRLSQREALLEAEIADYERVSAVMQSAMLKQREERLQQLQGSLSTLQQSLDRIRARSDTLRSIVCRATAPADAAKGGTAANTQPQLSVREQAEAVLGKDMCADVGS